MDDFSEAASEVEEILCEEHATPGTAYTSPWIEFVKPWMDTKRYSDTSSANTFTRRASPVVNADKHSHLNSLSSSTGYGRYKVDLWLSAPAGQSQSSTSRPNTRDSALSSVDGDQGQLSNRQAEDTSFDSTATGASALAPFPDSSLDSVQQPMVPQMDGSTEVPDSSAANQSELQTAHLSTRDPFFDSVPKGPSQLSILRWGTKFPTCNPLDSTCDQAPASPWDKTETSFGPADRVQNSPRPRLSLQIPTSSTSGDTCRSAPQVATRSEISNLQADAPHTTDSLVSAPRRSTPFEATQHHTIVREDILNPTARPFQSNNAGPRAPARRTCHTVTQPAAPSHTNSRTWNRNSGLTEEDKRWQRVQDCLGRINLLRSWVVPKTLKEWLAHQRDRTEAKREREQGKLENMNDLWRDARLPLPSRPAKIGPGFRGKTFEHKNYSSVLVCPSVWARTYEPPAERPDPPWPCVEEMKEEGDERNTSNYRRFLALPRVPGNNTVQYKLKAVQKFLPFDAVWKLPTKESVEAANEKTSPEEFEKMEGYLGRSLLAALDCITEDGF